MIASGKKLKVFRENVMLIVQIINDLLKKILKYTHMLKERDISVKEYVYCLQGKHSYSTRIVVANIQNQQPSNKH